MVKRLIWSNEAKDCRQEIFEFWNQQTGSKVYSRKLNTLFNEAAKLISNFPKIGRISDFENVRVKNMKQYQLFYRETESQIQILLVWDTRRDPDELNKILK
jgi:toxin YoeB